MIAGVTGVFLSGPGVSSVFSELLQSPFEWRCMRNACTALQESTASPWSICASRFDTYVAGWDEGRVLDAASGQPPDGDKVLWALRRCELHGACAAQALWVLFVSELVHVWELVASEQFNGSFRIAFSSYVRIKMCLLERGALRLLRGAMRVMLCGDVSSRARSLARELEGGYASFLSRVVCEVDRHIGLVEYIEEMPVRARDIWSFIQDVASGFLGEPRGKYGGLGSLVFTPWNVTLYEARYPYWTSRIGLISADSRSDSLCARRQRLCECYLTDVGPRRCR